MCISWLLLIMLLSMHGSTMKLTVCFYVSFGREVKEKFRLWSCRL